MTASAGNPLLNPTTRRVELARAIDAGNVRHYAFLIDPFTIWRRPNLDEQVVTARVAEMARAGIATYVHDEDIDNQQPVALTDTGRAWLAAAEADAARAKGSAAI